MSAEAHAAASNPLAMEGSTPPTVDWRAAVKPYVGPSVPRSLYQLASTLALLALTFFIQYRALGVSYWLTLALTPVASAMLVRLFIIMHDCTHGSFLPSQRAMDVVGYCLGVLTLTPYAQWRRDHAIHHATSGDLDRRGHGDIETLTVREYLALSPSKQKRYRLIRNPWVLMFGGPLHLMIGQRRRTESKATGQQQLRSVAMTNLGIVVALVASSIAFGVGPTLLIYFPAIYFAGMAGVWLFYVQHQFEDAYWNGHEDWSYADAALTGSSHLVLPKIFQWCTGNIGLHHVHHLAPRIPNYRLQECHDENPALQHAPVITFASGMRALKLALWDEDTGRLIGFDQLPTQQSQGRRDRAA